MLFRSIFPVLPLCSSLCLYSAIAKGQKHGSSFNASRVATDNIGLMNSGNIIYLVNVNVGGEEYNVQLDTGSSDLWVDGRGRNIKSTNSTGIFVNETYGLGSASGNLAFAEVRLGDFRVPSQVFVNASKVVDMADGIQGILGMAFDNGAIYETLLNAWGKQATDKLGGAFITNVFAENQSLPNNFDFQLGRVTFKDPAGTSTFTISGHAPGFEDVTGAPKLQRVVSNHWTHVLDEMRIDGNPFMFNKSIVPGVPEGNVLAVLDSGFTLPPLPKAAVDAIYSAIPGTVLYKSPDVILDGWMLPCDFAPVNLSFTLGGREYPVHPLDLFLPGVKSIVDNGIEKNVTVCVATYRAITLDPATFNTFDLILGDAFLRSVYASFDYNDYNPMNNPMGQPFVQMVSTVNLQTSKNEFDDYISSLRAHYPPFMEPSVFVTKQLSLSFTNSTASPNTANRAARVALAGDYHDATTGESANSMSKWGAVALGILAANLLIGAILVVVVVVVVLMMRGRSSNPGPWCTLVKFRAVSDHDSEVSGELRYSNES